MRVQTTQTTADGEPHPRSIRLSGMDEPATFDDDLVADVSDHDGQILLDELDFVEELGDDEDPDPDAAEPIEQPADEPDDVEADATPDDEPASEADVDDTEDDAAVTAEPAEAEANRDTHDDVARGLAGDEPDDHEGLVTDDGPAHKTGDDADGSDDNDSDDNAAPSDEF